MLHVSVGGIVGAVLSGLVNVLEVVCLASGYAWHVKDDSLLLGVGGSRPRRRSHLPVCACFVCTLVCTLHVRGRDVCVLCMCVVW